MKDQLGKKFFCNLSKQISKELNSQISWHLHIEFSEQIWSPSKFQFRQRLVKPIFSKLWHEKKYEKTTL